MNRIHVIVILDEKNITFIFIILILSIIFIYAAAAAKSLQSCLTLCDPMDCSLPGSSIHGIFRATVLEWGAIINICKKPQ